LAAFTGVFTAAALVATAFFPGFLDMTRTLIRIRQVYQLRHGQSFLQEWPRLV
jgi:hypothetical protein